MARGAPDDYDEPYRSAAETDRVRFFTDKNGVVHPIRATEEPPDEMHYAERRPEDDEPF